RRGQSRSLQGAHRDPGDAPDPPGGGADLRLPAGNERADHRGGPRAVALPVRRRQLPRHDPEAGALRHPFGTAADSRTIGSTLHRKGARSPEKARRVQMKLWSKLSIGAVLLSPMAAMAGGDM